jgi:hypothetical protein
MKKLFLAILFTIFSLQGHALEREIVVLTSIETPKLKPFWRSNNYEISKDIEKQFKKAFDKSGYKLVIKHNSSRENLAFYLQSSKTLALFWVSHAADEASVGGLDFSSIIQDINGNNVKNIFQKINPNVKFLSLIGCNAKNILEDFKNSGFYHSDLIIKSFDKKIRLNAGINEALEASAMLLDEDPNSFRKNKHDEDRSAFYREAITGKSELFDTEILPPKMETGMAVTIHNTNPEYSAELSVDGIFIGILKKDSSPQTLIIPPRLIGKKIKLKVDYDKASLETSKYLQPLDIQFDNSSFSFTYLKDKEGNPYGRGTNFYYLAP